MLADELDYVIGVDTHRDEHVWLSWRRLPARVIAQEQQLQAAESGYREALRPASGTRRRHGRGRLRAAAATAPASPALPRRGETVLELSRTPRSRAAPPGQGRRTRRGRNGASSARQRDTRSCRAQGERREALRLLLIARRGAVDVRREALTQLRAVIVSAPDRLPDSSARCRLEGCSSAADTSAARPDHAQTSSPPGSCCAASPTESKPQPAKPTTRARDPHPRTCACTAAARRARRRPDRRRATDRRLVAPRPAPL